MLRLNQGQIWHFCDLRWPLRSLSLDRSVTSFVFKRPILLSLDSLCSFTYVFGTGIRERFFFLEKRKLQKLRNYLPTRLYTYLEHEKAGPGGPGAGGRAGYPDRDPGTRPTKKRVARVEKVDPVNYPVSGRAGVAEETKGGTGGQRTGPHLTLGSWSSPMVVMAEGALRLSLLSLFLVSLASSSIASEFPDHGCICRCLRSSQSPFHGFSACWVSAAIREEEHCKSVYSLCYLCASLSIFVCVMFLSHLWVWSLVRYVPMWVERKDWTRRVDRDGYAHLIRENVVKLLYWGRVFPSRDFSLFFAWALWWTGRRGCGDGGFEVWRLLLKPILGICSFVDAVYSESGSSSSSSSSEKL